MANLHLGNIENWLNERIEHEMSQLIYEENENRNEVLKGEPKITFYQDIAEIGNRLKTIFYFFGFQDQEIFVAVLLDIIYKSKNGVICFYLYFTVILKFISLFLKYLYRMKIRTIQKYQMHLWKNSETN